MYFQKYFDENFTNIQKKWEDINSLLGRKKQSSQRYNLS